MSQGLFHIYSAPEELKNNGGPLFTSSLFQCVKLRLSSVAYLQSNGRVELNVKTEKRIVDGNMGP